MTSRAMFQAQTFAQGIMPTRDKLRRLRSEIRWHSKRDLGRPVLADLAEAVRLLEQADDVLGGAVAKAKRRAKQEEHER